MIQTFNMIFFGYIIFNLEPFGNFDVLLISHEFSSTAEPGYGRETFESRILKQGSGLSLLILCIHNFIVVPHMGHGHFVLGQRSSLVGANNGA